MNLQHKITAYFIRNEKEIGMEEVRNTLLLLKKYNGDLDGLEKQDEKELLRLVKDISLRIKIKKTIKPKR